MSGSVSIKLSRIKGYIPKVSMLNFNEFSWNIADGVFYGKGLDEHGNEIIIAIGGTPLAGTSPDNLFNLANIKQDKNLTYTILHQTEIIIQHNLQKEPSVNLRDIDGNICIADIQHIDSNNTKITTADPFTGVAIFN